ncbi:FG-GAP repeat domain-containing protein [Nanoarchaeota archaeon]
MNCNLMFGYWLLLCLFLLGCSGTDYPEVQWQRMELEAPNTGNQQTASLIVDLNNNGIDDIVVAERSEAPALVWYEYSNNSWSKHVIDSQQLRIEAGGAYSDIDFDGDIDLVFGGDHKSNNVWWWENPHLGSESDWQRHNIKDSGANKHHDQLFADIDNDGTDELIFWNQGAKQLVKAEIPEDLTGTGTWELETIYTYEGDDLEGLAAADIDQDGTTDIVGGGMWFNTEGAHAIDESQGFTRAAAGQLIPGGRPEVVFVPGDAEGELAWYSWNETWTKHVLLDVVDHGHSLQLADVNDDGNLDVFVAEMRLNNENPDAKAWIFYGDGNGTFTEDIVMQGYGNHEARLGDLDGDGTLDILGKPYNWDAPRLDVWLNQGGKPGLDNWNRTVIDNDKGRSLFVVSGDIDNDGDFDHATGPYWYNNLGNNNWSRQIIGEPLNNVALIEDLDNDGDLDLFGGQGIGSENNPGLAWAENTGNGFVVHVIEGADGDFLQGVVAADFDNDGNLEIALSWHEDGKGIQLVDDWEVKVITETSQDEDLSVADIDNDGDMDLIMGTKWLRNGDGKILEISGREMPDRNEAADINNDGRVDVVVGFEAISKPGLVVWYENTGTSWIEHIITEVIGPMSLDVADIDNDGDMDVIVGEHNMEEPDSARLFVYEQKPGFWEEHLVYEGDEHHDGAQVVDGNIISIGWSHGNMIIYEGT